MASSVVDTMQHGTTCLVTRSTSALSLSLSLYLSLSLSLSLSLFVCSAAHLLSDVASFAISLFAVWLAERKPTARATFGYHRIEIFGAIMSVFLIWVLTGVLCYEAVLRIITPEDVEGRTMFIVAALGVIVNLVMMQILSQGGGNDHGHSHNPIELFKALFKKGGGDHGHSHGGAGVSDHGHSHGGAKAAAPAAAHGHSHGGQPSSGGGHGHSHGGQPSGGGHGHAHGSSDQAPAPSASPTGASAHSHAHGGGGHGHAHGVSNGSATDLAQKTAPAAHEHAHGSGDASCSSGHGHVHSSGGDSRGERLSSADGGGGKAAAEDENINVRAAFIHALGDLVQSVGVVIAAVIIWVKPEYHIADPICTFIFSVLVLFTTWSVLKQAFFALLNSVPTSLDFPKLAARMAALPGVANVHDLHVWSYGSGLVAMTVHLVADHPQRALHGAQLVARDFGISHSTVQVERCGSAQVADCYAYNEHMAACALMLSPSAAERFANSAKRKRAVPHPVSFDGAAAPSVPRTNAADGDEDSMLLDRPHPLSLHTAASGGCDMRIIAAEGGGAGSDSARAPPPGIVAAPASHGGHGHSHGGGGHGHSHGSSHYAHGHSHSTASAIHTTSSGGHSH